LTAARPPRRALAAGNGRGAGRGGRREGRFPGVSGPLAAAALLALALGAGCGPGREPVPEAPAYADPGWVEAGGWQLHYALTPSRDLPSAVAGSYGIEQRSNLAVLVVALAPSDGGTTRADAPEASADVVALTGERAPVALARRDEAGRPTWLASVEIRNRVPVTIEIRARAARDGPELRARLTRDFRFE
jgi:uncharacterized protein DUF4426